MKIDLKLKPKIYSLESNNLRLLNKNDRVEIVSGCNSGLYNGCKGKIIHIETKKYSFETPCFLIKLEDKYDGEGNPIIAECYDYRIDGRVLQLKLLNF